MDDVQLYLLIDLNLADSDNAACTQASAAVLNKRQALGHRYRVQVFRGERQTERKEREREGGVREREIN